MQGRGLTPFARLIKFEYDWKSRRIRKQVWNNTGGTGTAASDQIFLYDGWNLLAVLNYSGTSLVRSFLWGLDLSGTLQGAGGVGGLLAVFDSSTLNSQPSTHFAAFDGNGNVAALVNVAGGTVSARYDYGPFGEAVRTTGPMAKANPSRFSTKYQDDETDLLYYGYRCYQATTGRWLSRDPLNGANGTEARYENLISYGLAENLASSQAEAPEDLNPYGFARNAPVEAYDFLGLCVPLPDSGPGAFHNRFVSHQWPFRGRESSLTFNVCCPICYPYLAIWGLMSPLPAPGPTWHGNTFPGSYGTVRPGPSGSGPCYTIEVIVTSTESLDHILWPRFIDSLRIVGGCCSTKSPSIQRSDPEPVPQPPWTPPPIYPGGY